MKIALVEYNIKKALFINTQVLPIFIKKLELINTSNKTEHLTKNSNQFIGDNL